MLASSSSYRPLDSALVSMLRESSPTDELFYMGAANDPESRNDIYSETRYILCHMISELFIHLGGGLENMIIELIESDEGYRRLVGVQIVYLMKRKVGLPYVNYKLIYTNSLVNKYLSSCGNLSNRESIYPNFWIF